MFILDWMKELGSRLWNSILIRVRGFAPHIDAWDVLWGGVLLFILVLGWYLVQESSDAPSYSGVIALIAASSAFIALYQHRHKLDKTRPAVREDFEERGDDEPLDFGLRNYGPGSAHYLQAVATVEKGDDVMTVNRFDPHDIPIHLEEGEFVGLVHETETETETDWFNRALDHYDLESRDTIDEGCPAMVNLYYSYVSHSGAREPVTARAEREDENILDRLKDPDSDARRTELWRLEQNCLAEGSDSQT